MHNMHKVNNKLARIIFLGILLLLWWLFYCQIKTCSVHFFCFIATLSISKRHMWNLKKKTLYPFLWMGFNCLKATEPLQRNSLLFTTKIPEIPGTHLINLGRKKGWVGQWFWTRTLGLGIQCLKTTWPLLHDCSVKHLWWSFFSKTVTS